MADFARHLAEYASFQAFVNCYLREVDGGCWLSPDSPQTRALLPQTLLTGKSLLQLTLPRQELTLWLLVSYRSRVGRHRIEAVFCQQGAQLQQEGFWSTLLLLVKELFHERNAQPGAGLKRRQLELTHRLTDSLQNTVRYLEARWPQPYRTPLSFCRAEQSLVLGHWLHPTPKSRQGILDWQHPLITPELEGQFQLHYVAVHRDWVEQQSLLPQSAETLVREALMQSDHSVSIGPDEVLIPVHPLQAHWLLAQPRVQAWQEAGRLRYLGPLGHTFTATSSVRTVYHRDAPWMYKLSLPVKITNSLRQNRVRELRAGVLMAGLLHNLQFSRRFPRFQVIADPAYLTVRDPEGGDSGFEAIVRANPFGAESDQSVLCLAALVQEPWHPRQRRAVLTELIERQALEEGRAPGAVARDWFDAYWHCAVEPCLVLFDHHGIALEAHQQNSLLRLADGYPETYYYRDNQGFYLDEQQKPRLLQWQPTLEADSDLFYPTDAILDRFGYYLLVNQVFAVVDRLGADGLLPEAELIERVRDKLEALRLTLSGNGRVLIERWLTQTQLPAKANLLTRVEDIDELEADMELAAYTTIDNPLCAPARIERALEEVAHV